MFLAKRASLASAAILGAGCHASAQQLACSHRCRLAFHSVSASLVPLPLPLPSAVPAPSHASVLDVGDEDRVMSAITADLAPDVLLVEFQLARLDLAEATTA